MSTEGTKCSRVGTGLGDNEKRLQAIFSLAAVGIAQIGLDGAWLLVNNRYCEMLGYAEAELRRKTLQDITHPDDWDQVLAGRHQLLAGEISSHAIEKRFIRKDGTIFWARLHRSLVRDGDNRPRCVIALVEDITEKIQADRALRESEQRFALAEKAAHLAIWDRDLSTNLIAISGEYNRMYGLSADHPALAYEEWLRLIHPEDRERVREHNRDTLTRTNIWDEEFRVVWPDGSVHWLLGKGTVFRDDAGQPVRIAGVNLDITERKRAEEALRDSEARLRESDLQYKEVFDNISVCMFLIDVTLDGRFKFVGFNRAEEEAIGFSNAEVSGRFVEDVFGEELANKLTADYRRCLEAGRAIHYDSELNLPRGRRYFHSNLIPLRNDAGVISRIIGACIDTTDLRRTQEEALAKQNLEGLGVLAGGIAHDFNNVLGGILAQAELVEPDLPVGSAPIQEIQRIKAAALRGSEIVRELMIYAGQDQTNLVEPVDVSRLVGEILELVKVSISKQAVLRTELSDDLPPVLGNSPQIRQVVMNLIINASEAIGDKEGVITLTTTQVNGGRDLAPNGAKELPLGNYVRLEVSDTGGGITEEAKEKIFDPFFSTKFAGRGMGLAVVQRVVRDHGGAINIVSAPGQGATFQVLLPCRSKEASEIHSAIPSVGLEQSNAPTGTILVVEDEEILRLAVSKLLRKIGFSVMAASDGSAAIDLVRTHKDEIDVILLDLTLPGLSSRKVFEEAQRVQPNLKVVLTSAYSKETVEASLTGLRITHFIRKPFQLGELGGVLRDALSHKASAGHTS
jgi:two-component system cell cycle sensor histidine kinase/response regulator CckA